MKKREIVSIFFVTTLLVSNIMAAKLVGGTVLGLSFTLPAAVVLYPFCFMLGDIMTEVWGFKHARRVIITGFAANLLMTLFLWVGQMLPPTAEWTVQAGLDWTRQEAYEAIFGTTFRIVLGSITAYIAGELINSLVLDKMKEKLGPKRMYLRTIGSSVVGQVFDTGLFIGIAFYGVVPNGTLLTMMAVQYIIKLLIEAVFGTPLLYLLVYFIKREGKDNGREQP